MKIYKAPNTIISPNHRYTEEGWGGGQSTMNSFTGAYTHTHFLSISLSLSLSLSRTHNCQEENVTEKGKDASLIITI